MPLNAFLIVVFPVAFGTEFDEFDALPLWDIGVDDPHGGVVQVLISETEHQQPAVGWPQLLEWASDR